MGFEHIWDDTKELLVSMDAVICWRPWGEVTSLEEPKTEGFHLDQNPLHKPGLEVVQGMVPLHNVTKAVGGLCVVPRSHLLEAQTSLLERCPQFANIGDWCVLPDDDPCIEKHILLEARAGDLILWDGRTIHGGKVGTGNEDNVPGYFWRSHLARMAVPIAMTPKSRASEEVLRVRREGFEKGRCFNHTPHEAGTSSGTLKSPVQSDYRPCKLTSEQHQLIDGKVLDSSDVEAGQKDSA